MKNNKVLIMFTYNVLTYAEIEKHTKGIVLSVIVVAYTNNASMKFVLRFQLDIRKGLMMNLKLGHM